MGFFWHPADSWLTFALKLAKSKPSRAFQNHNEPAAVSYKYSETVFHIISVVYAYSSKHWWYFSRNKEIFSLATCSKSHVATANLNARDLSRSIRIFLPKLYITSRLKHRLKNTYYLPMFPSNLVSQPGGCCVV